MYFIRAAAYLDAVSFSLSKRPAATSIIPDLPCVLANGFSHGTDNNFRAHAGRHAARIRPGGHVNRTQTITSGNTGQRSWVSPALDVPQHNRASFKTVRRSSLRR